MWVLAQASNTHIWPESKPQQYASLSYGQMWGTHAVTLNTIVILTERD